MFNHHNPLNEKDYDYYIRCVDRFKKLLSKPDKKLFILFYQNFKGDLIEEYNSTIKMDVINFNHKLLKYTNNFKILCIIHHINNKKYCHTKYENIDFLDIYTDEMNHSLDFKGDDDNKFIDKFLNETYKFSLI
jgi:hypothetical protein